MSITDQITIQAKLMSNGLDEGDYPLLEAACRAAEVSLAANLRPHLKPGDCLDDFVTAAAMMGLATMSEIGSTGDIQRFTAGDVSIQRNANAAAGCLRLQAQVLMAPYLASGVAFLGV